MLYKVSHKELVQRHWQDLRKPHVDLFFLAICIWCQIMLACSRHSAKPHITAVWIDVSTKLFLCRNIERLWVSMKIFPSTFRRFEFFSFGIKMPPTLHHAFGIGPLCQTTFRLSHLHHPEVLWDCRDVLIQQELKPILPVIRYVPPHFMPRVVSVGLSQVFLQYLYEYFEVYTLPHAIEAFNVVWIPIVAGPCPLFFSYVVVPGIPLFVALSSAGLLQPAVHQ